MQNRTVAPRIDFIDAARALSAVMGIILHTAAGYLRYPEMVWPRFGEQCSILFDYLACIIHMFRVPVFFFLGGLFAYHIVKKSGYLGFIKNRINRIAIPFLFFSLLLNLPYLLNKFFLKQIYSLKDRYFLFYNMSFLWFLEYLLFYYILFLLFMGVLRLLKDKLSAFKILARFFIESRWRWLPIIMLNFFFLYMTGAWYTPILLSFVPNIWLLGIYAIYFSLGIMLANNQKSFDCFFAFKWGQIVTGGLVYSAYMIVMLYAPHRESVRILAVALYSVANYLLFMCFFSICFQFFSKRKYIFRYLADASYCIYLCQIFFIAMVQPISAKYFDSIFFQFAVTCLFTLLFCLLVYHFFVGQSVHKTHPISSVEGKWNSGSIKGWVLPFFKK